MVEVIGTDEFADWFLSLSDRDAEIAERLVDVLQERGLSLGYPLSSDIKGSRYALRELRGQGRPLRIFYAFDPERSAVLILGGDKTGDPHFYERLVPQVEKIWARYLTERKESQ